MQSFFPSRKEMTNLVLVNKMDALEAFDFDLEKLKGYIHMRKPGIPIYPVSAVTGEGMDAWCEWLENEVAQYLKEA